jgi:hypothetical protein
MSAWLECGAVSTGEKAWESCVRQSPARVIGVTSRGVFLLVPPQRIIFVSIERYRSPLTINLDRSWDRLCAIEVGAAAQFSATRLIFPSIEFSISLLEDVVWRCPSPGVVSRSRMEPLQTVRMIAECVLAQRGGDGLAALLPILLEWPDAAPLSAEQSALLDRLIALRHAVQVGDNAALLTGLTGLSGQGRGLTPSGDDVVIGLVLMLNRWHTERDWAEVNRTVIEAAYRTTTTTSANLIECAADGQGDERLITVVDGITAGSASIDECVECVLGWGSSSGTDALVGMAIVT